MCRGTQCQGSRDSRVVAFTSEPSSIYSCLHIQHTQQTSDLPPLSTSVVITASSLLIDKEKSEISSASSLLHHHWYIPGERGALASKPCSKFRRKSSLVIAQPKECTQRSKLDRQTDRSQTPEDTSLPSCTHRG